jgi:hypothetical protein
MATSVYFNGKLRTLPGAYSTITSGDSTASRSLDYGTVLIIDTGVYGAGFGGGAGVNGEGAQGLDAIYEFDDLTTFRNFVKGGMYWKCAEALWKPDPSNADAVGISKLLFVRACTTKAAKMTFTATGGGSNGGTFVIRTIDEGLNANGVTEEIDGVTYLKNGYAFTTEAGVDNPEAVVLKLWQGTFTGLYKDPVTGVELSYNELTVEQSDANLLCESPECTTMAELIYWAQTDENFGARFVLDDATAVKGTGEMNASDVTDGYQLAAGGTETYTPNTDLESVLSQIADVDYNIVMTDQIGANALSAANKAIIAHRNLDAKFDKFVFIGAYDSRANYEASLAYAKQANNAYVCIVHGGIGTASDMVASKIRWWGVFYNLCQVVGRTAGKPPYVPITNKTIGGDKLQMIPNEKEMEKAVKAGLIIVSNNPYLKRFVILQGVTTLQDNTLLFNKKGQSFSLQFMRCLAQLNKECVVNAEIDLLADENGVNINTLSKGALETWTINFLQTRVATENQDNLISKFQNVVASRENDYYRVTYEVMINNEVTKIFFTGFLLRN